MRILVSAMTKNFLVRSRNVPGALQVKYCSISINMWRQTFYFSLHFLLSTRESLVDCVRKSLFPAHFNALNLFSSLLAQFIDSNLEFQSILLGSSKLKVLRPSRVPEVSGLQFRRDDSLSFCSMIHHVVWVIV